MNATEDRMIRDQKELKLITGLTRQGRYKMALQGRFPQPVSLGSRAIGYLASDLQAWLRGLAERRDAESGASKGS